MSAGWIAQICGKYQVFIQFKGILASKFVINMCPKVALLLFISISAASAVLFALMPNLTALFLTTRQLLTSTFDLAELDTAVSQQSKGRNPGLFKITREKFCSRSFGLSALGSVEPVSDSDKTSSLQISPRSSDSTSGICLLFNL